MKLIVKQIFLERLILQSVSCFKEMKVFNNWLNDRPSSFLHGGLKFMVSLVFPAVLLKLVCGLFGDTRNPYDEGWESKDIWYLMPCRNIHVSYEKIMFLKYS